MKKNNLRIYTFCSLVGAMALTANCGKKGDSSNFVAKVGEPLPAWTEGTLDIHSISSGRGESFLYIFPDGTSMLIDAGGSLLTDSVCAHEGIPGCFPFRPNGDISAGTVVADYVKYFNPNGETVDYWVNSHLDTDHMGNFPETYAAISEVSRKVKKHPEGNFYLNGVNEVGTLLNFKKVIDRDYTTPIDRSKEKRISDYVRFLDWTKRTKGTVYEPAKVGSTDQIVMTHNPGKYPDFKVRVLCASGNYWTGKGEETKCNLPLDANGQPDKAAIKKAKAKENIYSVGMLLNFGKFDLFTAGDLQYNNREKYQWMDADAPLIPVVKQVEVMKASHHGTVTTNSPELLAVLKPQTVLVNAWRTVQPRQQTYKDIISASPKADIFANDIHPDNLPNLAEFKKNMTAAGGHTVIRVAPNGDYMVFMLDDTNQEYRVKSIHGTYKSH